MTSVGETIEPGSWIGAAAFRGSGLFVVVTHESARERHDRELAAKEICAACRVRRGDGTAVAIRGLTQMQTTLNGREIFSAGTGRSLEFADIPAEMLAGIRVYKTSSAPQIEGGIGGLVDLRTRRPFDFAAGPLLRVEVFSLDDGRAALLVTLHHIVFDGGSMGVCVK